MKMPAFLSPKPTISDEELSRGLRWFSLEGMASLGFFSITTSGFLAAFALALDANNLQIGVLAAIPFLTQPLQIAAIPLVERLRRRKLVAVIAFLLAQCVWIPIALIPVFMDVPGAAAVSMLLGLLAIRGVFVALHTCAWNSWIRDLIPQQTLGKIMGRRLSLAAVVAMLFGLGAAFFADWWKAGHASAEVQALGYTYPLLVGIFTLALMSPVFMSLMPEPLMPRSMEDRQSLLGTIAAPFRDQNYRRLLRFLFLWSLAINLATPFFAVYMLDRLGLPLSAVIGFSILSQAFNVLFLRVWGRFADQFGTKAIFSVSVSLYLLVILGWTFTTMPERYSFTIPLLVILHVLAGIAAAGVTLNTATIGMKLAPQGKATAYLAGAGLAASLGAGLGPMMGGQFADYFETRGLSLNFEWFDPERFIHIGVLDLTGFDFLFGITFLLGLVTLTMLGSVREEGEVSREVVVESLFAPIQSMSRPISSVAGLGFLSQFPYGRLARVPVPGLDVALGVTAYQIAETARVATVATARGKRVTARLGKALEEGIRSFAGAGAVAPRHAEQVARHAARGAVHGLGETAAANIGRVSKHAVVGVARAFRVSRGEAGDVLRGVGYGIVEGSGEVEADVGDAVTSAVNAAREAASDLGMSEEDATREVVQGALDAAEAIGPDAADQVREAVPEVIMEILDLRSVDQGEGS